MDYRSFPATPIQSNYCFTLQKEVLNLDILRNTKYKFRRKFYGVHRNALVFLIFHPLYIIPFTLFSNYEALYRQTVGLTGKQLGVLTGILMLVRAVASLFGGAITDRLGRKLTTTLTDMACWVVPSVIFAFSHNFAWFLVGTIFNGLNSIVSASFTCMFVEGTCPEKRSLIYYCFNLIAISAGFFMPFGGVLVEKYGMLTGGRIMYIIAALSITLMSVARWFLLKETEIGVSRMAETKSHTSREVFADYQTAMKHILSRPAALSALFLFIVQMIHTSMMNAVVHPIFLTDFLGFSKASIAIFPMVSSATMLAFILLALPRIQGNERRGVYIGICLLSLGWFIMGILAQFRTGMVYLATMLTAAGWALFSPGLNTLWANAIDDDQRAKAQSIKDLTAAVFTAPAGYIGANLYLMDPRIPYVLIFLLYVAGVVACRWTIRQEKRIQASARSRTV